MMSKKEHSIGSLETWEPNDKSFTKHILKPGTGDVKANEGSVITVNITPLGKAGTEVFRIYRKFISRGL